jgi:hypothetical protein
MSWMPNASVLPPRSFSTTSMCPRYNRQSQCSQILPASLPPLVSASYQLLKSRQSPHW